MYEDKKLPGNSWGPALLGSDRESRLGGGGGTSLVVQRVCSEQSELQ